MATLATAVPPLPPEVAQQQSLMPALAEMGRMQGGIPDPIGVLEQKIAELENWAGQTAPLLSQVNPALAALLVPIAQAGKALQGEVASMRERMGGQSPMVQGSIPPNVPGNVPGARPAM